MANGKGALECGYCSHAVARHCGFHDVELPASPRGWNLVCGNFSPSPIYWEHSTEHCPPNRRFAWFGRDLEPGVLYHFQYNSPESAEPLAQMRLPDYTTGGWVR